MSSLMTMETMECDAVRKLLGDEDSMAKPEMLRLSLLLRLVRFVSRGVSIISGNAEHHGGVLVSSYLNRLDEGLKSEDVSAILCVEDPTSDPLVLAEALVMSWILKWVKKPSRDRTRSSMMGIHPVGISIGT